MVKLFHVFTDQMFLTRPPSPSPHQVSPLLYFRPCPDPHFFEFTTPHGRQHSANMSFPIGSCAPTTDSALIAQKSKHVKQSEAEKQPRSLQRRLPQVFKRRLSIKLPKKEALCQPPNSLLTNSSAARSPTSSTLSDFLASGSTSSDLPTSLTLSQFLASSRLPALVSSVSASVSPPAVSEPQVARHTPIKLSVSPPAVSESQVAKYTPNKPSVSPPAVSELQAVRYAPIKLSDCEAELYSHQEIWTHELDKREEASSTSSISGGIPRCYLREAPPSLLPARTTTPTRNQSQCLGLSHHDHGIQHTHSRLSESVSSAGNITLLGTQYSDLSCGPSAITSIAIEDMELNRANTFDSTMSAPSPDYPYSRKGSTAQLSIASSQSSLGGRDGYTSASEQESVHSAHTSTSHQGRSSGASPALANTPTQASNLSGLVCNVHRTTGREPSPLVGATTTILGDKLYVFAGRRISRNRPVLTQDLYELDLLRRHWTKLEIKGDIPSPRYFHSVCALGDNKLVCFGGMSAEQGAEQNENQETQVMVMADIHIYDVPTHTWMEVATAKSPQGRYAHCAAILPSSAVFSSSNAPFCAIQNNPSGTDPNSGSIGIQIDGTGGAEMIVVGGQDSSNNYIEQISVFNLRSLTWTSTHPILGRSCGAYRSVVTPLTTMSAAKIGAGPGRPDEEEDDGDEDADDADLNASGSPMLIYTNYNFLDVRLELQVRLPDGSLIDKPMQSTVSPPGLRFPTGGIIDNHFVVAGTFLTSSKQEYSLWSLDLRTLAWARIDTGSGIFSQGSWNRGLVWNRRNSFVILGNRKRSLTEDYNNRRLNFSNMCVIQLEAFGLYDNPRRTAPTSDYVSGSAPSILAMAQEGTTVGGRQLSAAAEALGVYALESRELSDMYFLGVDSSRFPVNSRVVARRWGPYFNSLLRESTNTGTTEDTATVRPAASILSRNSSITITPSLGSSLTTTLGAHTPHTPGIPTSDPADARALPPNSRPRVFFLPHTAPTLQALVYWIYTASLPASCPTQTLCSLLQIARPYRLDGLLEAVIQRLHEILDSRNAAAVFNAAAMGAGGGRDVAFANSGPNVHPPRTASLAGLEGLSISNGGARAGSGPLRIDTDVANGLASRPVTSNTLRAPDPNSNATSGNDDDAPDSASTTHSLGSQTSLASGHHTRRENREVWNGENSAVIGLQKRGLRGLMEGRRNRDRGSARNEVPPTPAAETTRIGLGIA